VETRDSPASLRLVVVVDFVCPWSYIARPLVERVCDEYGLAAVWRPHALHPATPPEGIPLDDLGRRDETAAWIRDLDPALAARMTFPDRIAFSFRAFEALELASDRGVAGAFVREVFDALWVDGEDIGDIAVLARAGARAGLDARDVRAALRSHAYAGRALEAVAAARRNGIGATPTFFVGRTRLEGWHYYEVLQSIVERQGGRPRTRPAAT
jgi:predicted DsbA family dithiol-disulfide isomerase